MVNSRRLLDRDNMDRMDGLHSYMVMDDLLEKASYVARELLEEGWNKDEVMEFIERKVGMHLMLDL